MFNEKHLPSQKIKFCHVSSHRTKTLSSSSKQNQSEKQSNWSHPKLFIIFIVCSLWFMSSGVKRAGVPPQQSVQGLPRITHLFWRATIISCLVWWHVGYCFEGWRYLNNTHSNSQTYMHVQADMCDPNTHTLHLWGLASWQSRIKTGSEKHTYLHTNRCKNWTVVAVNDDISLHFDILSWTTKKDHYVTLAITCLWCTRKTCLNVRHVVTKDTFFVSWSVVHEVLICFVDGKEYIYR